MIDVVFLLLIFFVWTASFKIVENVLPTSVWAVTGTAPSDPEEPPPPEADFDDVVVRVRWDGGQPAWTVNDMVVRDLEEMSTRLVAIANAKHDAPVIVHSDPDVPFGHSIDVYDLSRIVGLEVRFAVSDGS